MYILYEEKGVSIMKKIVFIGKVFELKEYLRELMEEYGNVQLSELLAMKERRVYIE